MGGWGERWQEASSFHFKAERQHLNETFSNGENFCKRLAIVLEFDVLNYGRSYSIASPIKKRKGITVELFARGRETLLSLRAAVK